MGGTLVSRARTLVSCLVALDALVVVGAQDCATIVDGKINSDKEGACVLPVIDGVQLTEDIDEYLAPVEDEAGGVICCNEAGDQGQAECKFQSDDGKKDFCLLVDWQTASDRCAEIGMDLCTSDQLKDGVENGWINLDCLYKWQFIWTKDKVSCDGNDESPMSPTLSPVPRPTPSPVPRPTSSPVQKPSTGCAWIADGKISSDKEGACELPTVNGVQLTEDIDEYLAPVEDEAGGVICCNDAGDEGQAECKFQSEDGKKDFCLLVDWQTASDRCAEIGMGLCTREQLKDGVENSWITLDCLYKWQFIWTKDTQDCDGNSSPTPRPVMASPTPRPVMAPSSGCTYSDLDFESFDGGAADPALYFVDTSSCQIIAEVPEDVERLYLEDEGHGDAVDSLTVVAYGGSGNSISEVEFTLTQPLYNIDNSDWEEEKKAAVPIPDFTLINEQTMYEADGFALYGVNSDGSLAPGFPVGFPYGYFQLKAVFPDLDATLKPKFRIYPSSDGNPLPDENRPQTNDDYVLHVVPYAQLPFGDTAWDRGGSKSNEFTRINVVVPHEEYVYICMELTAVIYKVQGDLTFDEKTDLLEENTYSPWFDVYEAVPEATAIDGNGPERQVDTISTQHSGLRSIAFHKDYASGEGYIYTAHLERRPDTVGDSNTNRNCTRPDDWHFTGDFLIGREDEYEDACADAVVVEWYVTGDSVQVSSYRLLVRLSYGKTGVNYAEYEHPIKQMGFKPDTTELYIESGDGSVDSKVAFGGQSSTGPYGVMIRIDVGGYEGGSHFEYGIPSGNYAEATGNSAYLGEVCAIGFRNPHSMGWFTTGEHKGKLLMFDGGRDNAEEVNLVECGENYGWSNREGIWVQFDDINGLWDGIYALPDNDADFGYQYPRAMFAHDGEPDEGFGGQCGVGSFPIETDSELKDHYCFGDFPKTGYIYCATTDELMADKERGDTTLASLKWMNIKYYESTADCLDGTVAVESYSFRELSRYTNDKPSQSRTDLRFSKATDGSLLIMSKRDGRIYQVVNSIDKDKTDQCTG
ncbi:hypothetical protein CTAYLR_002832 [Chrysophaeum taylorii]|uniref:Glucose/Sorbosone dehydrogenase domain-containing protein n=1 Tax=Chrysophaeum taylorii TaxID=2483200 RepID=A0AAD7U8U3_9STRA|nr:hypothetical protein CTAYLR_002832 [Chrysophaeum taylorii]